MLMNIRIFTVLVLLCSLNIVQVNGQNRLAATSMYDYNGNWRYQDSMRFWHSAGTASNEGKFNIPEYDNLYDSAVVYDASMSLDKTHSQSFDGSNHLTERIVREANGDNDSRIVISYTGGKPDTTRYYTWRTQGGGSWSFRSYLFYSWSGNNVASITRRYYAFGSNPGWRFDYRHSWQYSSGNVVQYTVEDWSNGNWVNQTEQRTTYTSGRISKIENYTWDSGNSQWKLNDKDDYYYSGSKLDSVVNTFYDAGGNPFTGDKYTYIYNGSNTNPDSMIKQVWQGGPAYINNKRTAYQYNMAGQRTFERTESWSGSNWYTEIGLDTTRNYYYGSPQSVAEVNNKSENGVTVYPSPTSNRLNISIADVTANKEIKFSIIDITGKVQRTWAENTNGLVSVSVNELPSGTYILKVDDGEAIRNERFVISK